jgi:hypothetical protein
MRPLELSSYKSPSTRPTRRNEGYEQPGPQTPVCKLSGLRRPWIGVDGDMQMPLAAAMKKIHFENTTLPR